MALNGFPFPPLEKTAAPADVTRITYDIKRNHKLNSLRYFFHVKYVVQVYPPPQGTHSAVLQMTDLLVKETLGEIFFIPLVTFFWERC